MGDTVTNYDPINLDNDINEVNIGLYGKKFVDMTDEYVKEHQDYFKSMLQIFRPSYKIHNTIPYFFFIKILNSHLFK